MGGQGAAGMAAQHAAAAAGPTEAADVKVTKATGADARTVAEIWAQRDRAQGEARHGPRQGREVQRRASWARTGSTCATAPARPARTTTSPSRPTTRAPSATSCVVKGTVRVDKDFGAGYAYPVIIEDAKLSK